MLEGTPLFEQPYKILAHKAHNHQELPKGVLEHKIALLQTTDLTSHFGVVLLEHMTARQKWQHEMQPQIFTKKIKILSTTQSALAQLLLVSRRSLCCPARESAHSTACFVFGRWLAGTVIPWALLA